MLNKFQSQAIIVYYPCGTGGKFIINSLGLSRHCVPQDNLLSQWDIQQRIFDQSYYQKKLDQVSATVPPKYDLKNWQTYELGVGLHWLSKFDDVQTRLINIIDANRYFCLINHTFADLESMLHKYPGIKNIIKLTNYTKWLELCKFKISSIEHDIKNKIDYWKYIDDKEVANNAIPWTLVDIDNSMHNYKNMLQQIKNLYDILNFDDFDENLWSQYYKKYIHVHH
jgi:hypothetical protein